MNIFIAVIAAVVLGLGGFFLFSNQTPEDSVPPPITEPSPAPAPTPAVPPSGTNNQPSSSVNANVNVNIATASVGIVSYQYSPKVLTVKVGTKVTWTNQDTVAHTVTVTGANGGPDSTLFGQNESYSYTFDKVGTYEYYCKPHPYMKGTVVVTN